MKLLITPTLIVNDDEDEDTLDALAAFQKIRHEYERVQVRSLDAARDTMTLLGMSEEMQNDRIHFALTGEILGGY